MTLTFEQKYKAISKRDSAYEGIFVTAVKTTKIFCRPTCSARTPNPENITFYDSPKEALQHGFRPCKKCSPLELFGETPEKIKYLLTELQEQPHVKIKDSDLVQKGIEPNQIRRWFKKNHKMTFQSYQRMLRINGAYRNIIHGELVTSTAFSSGYNSLSGFNSSYQAIVGKSPTDSPEKTIINIVRFTTPIGPMFACATSTGVCLVEFTDRRMLETEFKDLRRRLNAEILPGTNEHLVKVQKELAEYFNGTLKQFTVTLHTPGTPFQHSVWEILKDIPYGETRSYEQQAIALKKPTAVRAVASANGHNRVSILIPCHRVIGKDGNLTGYGGGLARKNWLLDHERQNS
ncbi:MAG: methylated-DNA--[protein]-cysteine S-methyltransferase [bacterium]